MLPCRHLDLRRISRRRRQSLCNGSTHCRLDLPQGCLGESWQPFSYRVTRPEITLSPSASEGGGHSRSGRRCRHPAMLPSPQPNESPELTVSSWGKKTESAACSLARRPFPRQEIDGLPLDGQLVEATSTPGACCPAETSISYLFCLPDLLSRYWMQDPFASFQNDREAGRADPMFTPATARNGRDPFHRRKRNLPYLRDVRREQAGCLSSQLDPLLSPTFRIFLWTP